MVHTECSVLCDNISFLQMELLWVDVSVHYSVFSISVLSISVFNISVLSISVFSISVFDISVFSISVLSTSIFQCSVFQCLVFQYFVLANGAIEGVRSVLSLRTGRLPSKWVVLAQN